MTKIIAMTGATGFAGRHAVEAVLKRGYRVRALLRNPEAADMPAGVEAVAGGLGDAAALKTLTAGAHAVVHLAGAISAVSRSAFFDVNAGGAAALAQAAANAGTQRFIHVSSLAAREPGLSPYGDSKRAGEEAVAKALEPARRLILRPPAVYGPGDKATLPLLRELTRPVAMIPSRPGARFSLIHVADLAEVLASAIADERTGLIELNDGRAGGYGWRDLIAIAEAETGRRIRAIFLPRLLPELVGALSDVAARVTGRPGMVSRGKVAELYHADWVSRGDGWPIASPMGFAEGFAGTLRWYRERGWLPPQRAAVRSGADARRKT